MERTGSDAVRATKLSAPHLDKFKKTCNRENLRRIPQSMFVRWRVGTLARRLPNDCRASSRLLSSVPIGHERIVRAQRSYFAETAVLEKHHNKTWRVERVLEECSPFNEAINLVFESRVKSFRRCDVRYYIEMMF